MNMNTIYDVATRDADFRKVILSAHQLRLRRILPAVAIADMSQSELHLARARERRRVVEELLREIGSRYVTATFYTGRTYEGEIIEASICLPYVATAAMEGQIEQRVREQIDTTEREVEKRLSVLRSAAYDKAFASGLAGGYKKAKRAIASMSIWRRVKFCLTGKEALGE